MANEKVAIIGRNGVGKTTLFRLLNGDDQEYLGSIIFKKGTRVVATQQEHHHVGDQTVVQYILNNLPDYISLKRIIDTYPGHMGDDLQKITTYSEALEQFSSLDYYTVEDRIRQSLQAYQLEGMADKPLRSLSGGQKRFVELIRVEYSDTDLALIDEPTNHMDYVAKAAFLQWFEAAKHAVVVITHDRDVLQTVTRIIEIKDQAAFSFPGNYQAYLTQNAERTSAELNTYETTQRRIDNVKKQIAFARSKKAGWSGTADKKNPFVVMENRLLKELKQLEAAERPTFWIDQESVEMLRPKLETSYQKHKTKNIHIRNTTIDEPSRELIQVENLQVGYDHPLFEPVHFRLQTGERLQIIGRNGVGKTTLVRTLLEHQHNDHPSTLLQGSITIDTKARISTYEQELSGNLLQLPLNEAIESIYQNNDIPINRESIMRILSDYLFDPYSDFHQKVATLSGGQKARLQLIKLFANKPNVIILDEPTNHLDLPSIEELETALRNYQGALIYISHDSYVAKNLKGEALTLRPLPTATTPTSTATSG
jgi:ATPase subunit of ABC transporter with duplicated ATPase domains